VDHLEGLEKDNFGSFIKKDGMINFFFFPYRAQQNVGIHVLVLSFQDCIIFVGSRYN
jgi:hypothetical protein